MYKYFCVSKNKSVLNWTFCQLLTKNLIARNSSTVDNICCVLTWVNPTLSVVYTGEETVDTCRCDCWWRFWKVRIFLLKSSRWEIWSFWVNEHLIWFLIVNRFEQCRIWFLVFFIKMKNYWGRRLCDDTDVLMTPTLTCDAFVYDVYSGCQDT